MLPRSKSMANHSEQMESTTAMLRRTIPNTLNTRIINATVTPEVAAETHCENTVTNSLCQFDTIQVNSERHYPDEFLETVAEVCDAPLTSPDHNHTYQAHPKTGEYQLLTRPDRPLNYSQYYCLVNQLDHFNSPRFSAWISILIVVGASVLVAGAGYGCDRLRQRFFVPHLPVAGSDIRDEDKLIVNPDDPEANERASLLRHEL